MTLTGMDCLIETGVSRETLVPAIAASFDIPPDSVVLEATLAQHIDTVLTSRIWACIHPLRQGLSWAYKVDIDGQEEWPWPEWQRRMKALAARTAVPVWYGNPSLSAAETIWVVYPDGRMTRVTGEWDTDLPITTMAEW